MRDTRKTKEYFDAFIAEDEQRIRNFSEKLLSGDVAPDRVKLVTTKIHDLGLGVLIAKYSRGDSVEQLRDDFMALAESWEDAYSPEHYIKGLRMISLCVLFDADADTRRAIEDMLTRFNVRDWLYSFLLAEGKKRPSAEFDLLYPAEYQQLKKMVVAGSVNEVSLSDYLKHWYRHHRSCGWYDAHKSKQNIYYGYWSFEAGAVAKIYGVDDSSLEAQPYYPYDLVHFHVER